MRLPHLPVPANEEEDRDLRSMIEEIAGLVGGQVSIEVYLMAASLAI